MLESNFLETIIMTSNVTLIMTTMAGWRAVRETIWSWRNKHYKGMHARMQGNH